MYIYICMVVSEYMWTLILFLLSFSFACDINPVIGLAKIEDAKVISRIK